MFWRLGWRAVSVNRSQALLALGALVVAAAVASMLLNLYGDVRRKMTEDFRAYGANVVVAPEVAGTAGGEETSAVLEESALLPLADFTRKTPGMSFAPVLYGVVRVSPDSPASRVPESANVVAAGAEFGALSRLSPGWREAGEAVSGDLPPGDCAVGSHLAARLHLGVGDSIDLHHVPSAAAGASPSRAVRIATVLTTGSSEDDQVLLPLAALQSFLGMSGKVTLAELSVPGETRDVERAVHQLSGLLPGLEVRPIRQIVYSEGNVLGTIRWLLLSLPILILVITSLCVMATMTAIVLERRKDIGVMKALGAADRLLMRLFLAQGAGLGLVGGALGYAVGALLARGLAARLFGVTLSLQLWTLPVVSGLSVALAVFGAQVPVRIVRSIQPTAVLKGD